MAANAYRFIDRWRVPFPPEKVWEVLSRAEDYPRWWRGVYLSATPLDQDAKRVAVVARGRLPYDPQRVPLGLKPPPPREVYVQPASAPGRRAGFLSDAEIEPGRRRQVLRIIP